MNPGGRGIDATNKTEAGGASGCIDSGRPPTCFGQRSSPRCGGSDSPGRVIWSRRPSGHHRQAGRTQVRRPVHALPGRVLGLRGRTQGDLWTKKSGHPQRCPLIAPHDRRGGGLLQLMVASGFCVWLGPRCVGNVPPSAMGMPSRPKRLNIFFASVGPASKTSRNRGEQGISATSCPTTKVGERFSASGPPGCR